MVTRVLTRHRGDVLEVPRSLRAFFLGCLLLSFVSGIGGNIDHAFYSAAVHAALVIAIFRADIAGVVLLALLILSAARDAGFETFVPLLIVMALVANTQPLKRVVVLAIATVAWFMATASSAGFELVTGTTTLVFILVGVAVQGAVLRSSISQRRVERRQLAEATLRAENARTDERRRLAGELHDIVAHDLTVLTMLSTLGQAIDDPEKSKDTFSRMESTSRSALADLRRLLGVLERTETAPVSAGTSTSRVDLRAALDSGVEELTRLGLRPTLTYSGDFDTVPRSIQHGLRRGISEMLANAAKYTEPGGPVDINVTLTADDVNLRVANVPSSLDRPNDPGGMGLGLSNLQEQAEAFSGSFQAGLQGRRWVAQLSIPLQPREAEVVRHLSTWRHDTEA